jgi:8-oxo-dGTP pyrophosphatase MutT (NUDIX family)
MAKNERSAGVIVYREEAGQRLYLLLNYGKHWDYAKGHVEKGEDDLDAAWRELDEETGIKDAERVGDFAHEIIYFFRKPKKGLIRKAVIFFIAKTSRKRIELSHEHEGYAFLPYDEALERVTYKTAKDVLKQADAYLSKHATS